MKKILIRNVELAVLSVLIFVGVVSCQKEVFKQTTNDEVNITGYLEQHPEKYSTLLEILEKSGTQGYLGAYGTYTLFAPTNEAVKEWISEKGKSSVNDFSKEELLDFVKYHVVRDTVSTVRFVDGKIRTPTLFGEFLYTDVVNGKYRVNKYAAIEKSDIQCGNGVIHSVVKALTPPNQNLAQIIESNPRYSIFTAALKATGFYDTLTYTRGQEIAAEKRFQTVIVESDSVLNAAGITSFEDLKAKLSTKNDPKNHADSLWLFVAYHITNQGLFIQDIIEQGTLYTLAPKEIISTKYEQTKLLLNEDVFNGVLESGAEINRDKSDVLSVNGVLHESKHSFKIKVRKQVPVYWDVASSPELVQALGASYGNVNAPLLVNNAPIANSFAFNDYTNLTWATHRYEINKSLTATRVHTSSDFLNLSVCAANTARAKWVEFKTPFLVKGRYKVWICYVAGNASSPLIQVSFNTGKSDQQILPNLVDFRAGLQLSGINSSAASLATADNLMLAQGYKRYMATTAEYNENGVRGVKGVNSSGWDLNAGRLAGIIDVETTDRHTIRLEAIGGGCTSNYMWLDMIHFIPADDVEQNYPRFHPTPGVIFNRPN